MEKKLDSLPRTGREAKGPEGSEGRGQESTDADGQAGESLISQTRGNFCTSLSLVRSFPRGDQSSSILLVAPLMPSIYPLIY